MSVLDVAAYFSGYVLCCRSDQPLVVRDRLLCGIVSEVVDLNAETRVLYVIDGDGVEWMVEVSR